MSNPIIPGNGVCDPHIRIFNDTAYLYASHDKSPDNKEFVMEDWWIWSSKDLVNWKHECTLKPEETYIGPGFTSCWATDAAERNGKYYWYLSEKNLRTAVVVGETPAGPWYDPLGKPLIGDGVVPVEAYDPGVFIDDDGPPYLVFGVWEYYLARLNDDMISLAEAPRKLEVVNPESHYGKGKLDDKSYLHKRNGIYYLSWGCYYAMSDNPYGPYECKGSVVLPENIDERHRYPTRHFGSDRHGSFFEWRGQWYYIFNDSSISDNKFFRDSSICYLYYHPNGEMEPVKLAHEGVTVQKRNA